MPGCSGAALPAHKGVPAGYFEISRETQRCLLSTMETISSRGLTVLVLDCTVFLSMIRVLQSWVLVGHCDNRQVPGEKSACNRKEDGGV